MKLSKIFSIWALFGFLSIMIPLLVVQVNAQNAQQSGKAEQKAETQQRLSVMQAKALLGYENNSTVVNKVESGSLNSNLRNNIEKPKSLENLVKKAALKPQEVPQKSLKKEKKYRPVHAKRLFGFVQGPARVRANSVGSYAKGCLAGGEAMPLNGPAWQVMRLSRNRNWGHPVLIDYLKKLAVDVQQKDSWPGLLIGDLSQPRGGQMLTGHKSHQLGLDADIWMMGMPKKRLSYEEREKTAAVSMLGGPVSVNKAVFKPGHVKVLKRAASSSKVARIFVHPAIKKAVCEATTEDKGRARWLSKIRPWFGHHYHFHVRLKCPAGTKGCLNQRAVPYEDGCGKPLQAWIKRLTPRKKKIVVKKKKTEKKKKVVKKKRKKRRRYVLTLDKLPSACKRVLVSGDSDMLANLKGNVQEVIALPIRNPVR